MTRRRSRAWGLALGLLTAAPLQAAAPQAAWANYGTFGANDDGDIEHPSFGLSSDGEEYMRDVFTSLRFCPADSPYWCVWGELFHLAVPRHRLKADEHWHFGGYAFHVLPHREHEDPPTATSEAGVAERQETLVGDSIRYYAIYATRDGAHEDCNTVYLFSAQRGLIGVIDTACGTQLVRYNFVAEAYGPGAAQFDTAISAGARLGKQEYAALAAR